MILHGKRLIKVWTKLESIVCTAEAELYAGNRAATDWMGVQASAKDLGRAVPIRLHIDSSTALSTTSRTGLGKAKHIEIQHLLDQGTKHLASERFHMLTRHVNCFDEALDTFSDGRLRAHWPRLTERPESKRKLCCASLTIAPGGAVPYAVDPGLSVTVMEDVE